MKKYKKIIKMGLFIIFSVWVAISLVWILGIFLAVLVKGAIIIIEPCPIILIADLIFSLCGFLSFFYWFIDISKKYIREILNEDILNKNKI